MRTIHGLTYFDRWDALFDLRNHSMIGQEEIPPDARGRTYKRFRTRSPVLSQSPAERIKIQKKFERMAGKIQFELTSGWLDYNSHLPPKADKGSGFRHGITETTMCDDGRLYARVYLSFESLEPLLRSNHTDAERMVDRWRIVSVIMHESTVC